MAETTDTDATEAPASPPEVLPPVVETPAVASPPSAPGLPPPAEVPVEKKRTEVRSADQRILFHEELSWRQLDELDREHTLFLVTLAPLDQHGPHLPVGVDCFTAQAFSAAAARRLCTEHPEWTVVLSPILPIGSDTFDYLGSINMRRRVVRDLLADFLGSIASYEFQNILVISSHGGPGHLMAIDEACHSVNQRYGSRAFAPMRKILADVFTNAYRDSYRKILGKAEALDFSSDHHAGHWETSMLLYLRPELVDPGYTGLRPVIVEPEKICDSAARTYGDKLGYFGSPSQANRDLGKVSTALVGREIVDMFFLAQEDEGFLDEFAPPMWNAQMVYRTDFPLWALATLFVVLLAATWALFC